MKLLRFAGVLSSLAFIQGVMAQNPVIQTQQTTDPAPFVWNDTLYLYTGHDEDHADFFWMQEWRLYKTADMVNWTDLGSPLALEDFSWADDRAWAAQVCKRNGKFYWYVCAHSKLSNAMAIGVAVADRPEGPFKDAIGKPLVDGSWDYIDPTVLVDDDGQAYLYWGNPELYYVKLNDDMISLKDSVQHFNMDASSFGGPGLRGMQQSGKQWNPSSYTDIYTEGPWIMKRMVPVPGKRKNKQKSLYYMLYAAGGVPEHIAYSTADSPLGPWSYRGTIMPQSTSDEETGRIGTDSFTNHCGIADYKGHSYFFYHNGWIGGGFGRAVAIEEFQYNADGTFPLIHPTRQGVQTPLGFINPAHRVEAETMAFSQGLKSEQHAQTGVYISEIHNGDWLKVREVNFDEAKNCQNLKFSAASALRGGTIEMHLDSVSGPLVATLSVSGTGGWETWKTFNTSLNQTVSGNHDVYFCFKGRKGPKLFNLDWWQLY